ncbi:MAG: entericidin A/B family lipoprotein [Pseudomonadota bacterium]
MTRTATLILMFAALAGCETVGGLGQDIQSGGAAIEDTAGDVQADL